MLLLTNHLQIIEWINIPSCNVARGREIISLVYTTLGDQINIYIWDTNA